MIRDYFQQIKLYLASYPWTKSLQLLRYDLLDTDEEQILVYRIRASMSDAGILEIRERVVVSKRGGEIETTTYSFHWQDRRENLIKRWDNAPHFPDFEGFPHHIHIGEDDTVVPIRPINALEMIGEIDREVSNGAEKA